MAPRGSAWLRSLVLCTETHLPGGLTARARHARASMKCADQGPPLNGYARRSLWLHRALDVLVSEHRLCSISVTDVGLQIGTRSARRFCHFSQFASHLFLRTCVTLVSLRQRPGSRRRSYIWRRSVTEPRKHTHLHSFWYTPISRVCSGGPSALHLSD